MARVIDHDHEAEGEAGPVIVAAAPVGGQYRHDHQRGPDGICRQRRLRGIVVAFMTNAG